MRKEKAEYSRILIGVGGKKCSCCSPIPKLRKKLEHRYARHNEKKYIKQEMKSYDEIMD